MIDMDCLAEPTREMELLLTYFVFLNMRIGGNGKRTRISTDENIEIETESVEEFPDQSSAGINVSKEIDVSEKLANEIKYLGRVSQSKNSRVENLLIMVLFLSSNVAVDYCNLCGHVFLNLHQHSLMPGIDNTLGHINPDVPEDLPANVRDLIMPVLAHNGVNSIRGFIDKFSPIFLELAELVLQHRYGCHNIKRRSPQIFQNMSL